MRYVEDRVMNAPGSQRNLFVLGAGFAADAGIPLASDIMRIVHARLSAGTEPDIVHARKHLHDYLAYRDPERKLSFDELARASSADRSRALHGLRLGCLKAFWDLSHHQLPAGYRYFAQRAALEAGVILWNWDITLERAASEGHVRWTYDFREDGVRVRALKLHGSLNWLYTPGARPVVDQAWVEPYPAVYYLRATPLVEPDPRLILHATPMILPGEVAFLEPLWQAVESLLARADRLIFIGCGFPDYDLVAIRRMLRATKAMTFEVVSLGTAAKARGEKLVGHVVAGQSEGFLKSTYAAPTA